MISSYDTHIDTCTNLCHRTELEPANTHGKRFDLRTMPDEPKNDVTPEVLVYVRSRNLESNVLVNLLICYMKKFAMSVQFAVFKSWARHMIHL